jgi:SPP1 gp7 family putative phage head morphogenesis protein
MNTLGAATDFNHTLITNISEDIHEKIYNSIMLSLTSPNPEEQGMTGIENTLKSVGGFSKKRIALITEDQTSKLYSALSDERMRENNVDEFRWLHSSAGKVPRKTHVAKNNQIFKLDDSRLWEGPKADQGPPGWAIRCRCRKIPIIR